MKNFKELLIWQKGVEIAIKTFRLTEAFPREDKFGLCSQMTRAAISIASNIAEGISRTSQKDYSRFIEIALGSTSELETQLTIAEKLNKGDQKLLSDLKANITEE